MTFDEAVSLMEMMKKSSDDLSQILVSSAQDLQNVGATILGIAGNTSQSCSEAGRQTIQSAQAVNEAGTALVQLVSALESYQQTLHR